MPSPRISGNRTAEDVIRAYEEKLKQKPEPQKPRQVAPAITSNLKDLENYVLVPDTDVLIAKRQSHNNLDWYKTHETLQKESLFMPTPTLFIKYFMSVKSASEDQQILYDGNARQIGKKEADELWNYLSSADRSKFNDEWFWTWLDAKFAKSTGHKGLDLETEHRVVQGKLVPQKTEPLEACLEEDGLAKLTFNKQGLPTQKSSADSYQQSKNLYSYFPRDGAVAGFGADSDGAGLVCYGDPQNSNPALGVRACAKVKHV